MAAECLDPLREAEQPEATRRPVGRLSPAGAVVRDQHFTRLVGDDADSNGTAGCVPHDVGQGLLDDPVDRGAVRWVAAGLALHGEVHGHPGLAHPLHRCVRAR